MSGFAYVKIHSSLCPEKLASDLINQDKQSVFSYSPSLEEGIQVLKYAFECLTSDSCFWMFVLSHKQQQCHSPSPGGKCGAGRSQGC